MSYWWQLTESLMESFRRLWKVFFESRAHFSCCMCHIDVRKGKFATPEITRSLHLTLKSLETLATLCKIIREFLDVFHSQFGDLQKWTWEGGNNGLMWGISSEGFSRWLTRWILLEETLNMEIVYPFFLSGFSRFWLHYTRTQKLTRVWRHEESRVHVWTSNTCLRTEHSGYSNALLDGICSYVLSDGWATWKMRFRRRCKAIWGFVAASLAADPLRVPGGVYLQSH